MGLNYDVISEDNLKDFKLEMVKKIFLDTWKPQGGVCVVFRQSDTEQWYEYFQAIVKEAFQKVNTNAQAD